MTEKIRNYYCFWSLKNGLISDYLARRHTAFFQWLERSPCGLEEGSG